MRIIIIHIELLKSKKKKKSVLDRNFFEQPKVKSIIKVLLLRCITMYFLYFLLIFIYISEKISNGYHISDSSIISVSNMPVLYVQINLGKMHLYILSSGDYLTDYKFKNQKFQFEPCFFVFPWGGRVEKKLQLKGEFFFIIFQFWI